MAVILGVESTAHTFGIGVVKDGKVLSNIRDMYVTEKGGIIPMESAKHHARVCEEVYKKSLEEAKISEEEIDGVAFSQGPGLAPSLLEGIKFSKKLAGKLSVPLIPVNHCVAHLEIGRITGAKDPVMLYASGANTQIIAYEAGKYRVFGETLDVGIGNFIDTFARYLGLGFPGGPKIEELAKKSQNYIELPYTVKGMDIALSGILTNLKQKVDKIKHLHPLKASEIDDNLTDKKISDEGDNKNLIKPADGHIKKYSSINNIKKSERSETNYTLADLAFSVQETTFAMLVEVSERALAHTGKKELLLAGGVACNKRLQEMARIMCEERGAKSFCPERPLLVDNGAMIAFLGEIMFNTGIKFSGKEIDKLDILPRQRTDDVEVSWKD